MGAFTPFKRHANKFNYKPRFYDPKKEALEQRRAETRGERLDSKTSAEDYRPGQYIRTSSAARRERTKGSNSSGRARLWITIGVIILVAYFGSMLYSKLIGIFGVDNRSQIATERVEEQEEFNPYAPITIVPNDYDPSKEK